MSNNAENSQPGQAWRAILRTSGTPEFRQKFTPDVLLEASVIQEACVGVAEVSAFFAATAAGSHDSLSYTSEVVWGSKTFLEWEAEIDGGSVGGITILTRDGTGRIAGIRLYCRPLRFVRRLSDELARRLVGRVNPAIFGPRPTS